MGCFHSTNCIKCGIPQDSASITKQHLLTPRTHCRVHRCDEQGRCIDCDGQGNCYHKWGTSFCCLKLY